ncbi:unnamed protein product (macronuclear) [Paramecium tetraurelia]|uniref:Uncharacterized protein n=1 Tax=Paramecium tetraurelia TaxID=5888 RepID=A0E0H7_PARTE|nr:uncharacterized protein GSPATT00021962001 [Paramecium tetraurelia]CAK88794.1 unnamed protein product [Paramecium tetraurelia]|eukprot:XP_001456191.1 hypothetical protein (macronuclear) [Paramecium tetraurelia strain d4-2]
MLFSQRQSNLFEEMESIPINKMPQGSSRSRNLSNDRPQTNERSIKLSIENSRQRHKAESYSVEKSLNLSSQNQKVENLVASWILQKNSSSLNSSSNNVQPSILFQSILASQFESQGRQSNRPHIIIEEELLFTEEGDQQNGNQSNKVNQNKHKTPSTTRPHAKSIKEQCILLIYEESFDVKKNCMERNVPKKPLNSYAQRPQTTKMQTSTQVKSTPLVYKDNSLHNPMKSSQIEQAKFSNLYSGSNSYSNNIKNRNRQNNYQKIVKKDNITSNSEFQLDNQCIPDLIRLKDLILSTYLKQNRPLINSQNQIVKNFDEIVAILKQDFPNHI